MCCEPGRPCCRCRDSRWRWVVGSSSTTPSFTVMPRDKVGLVGRNGAGKTSLFKVLGGEAEPTAGRDRAQGRLRLPAAGPAHRPACSTAARAVTHVLSGRGIDDELVRIEKLRIAMEEDAERAQRRPLQPGRGRVRLQRRLRRRERGAGASPPASASAPTGIELPARRALAAASAAASSCPASCSPAATCCCSTSRPTTSTSTPRRGCSSFLRSYRGALLVISHDLELLDEAITRVLHLDRPQEDAVGHLVEYKGTYTPVPRRPGPPTRSAWPRQATLQAKEIARLQTIVDRFGAKATKAAMAHSKEKRIARLEAAAGARRPGRPHAAGALPRPAVAGRHRAHRRRACPRRYGGPPVFEDVSFDLGRGERLLVLGLNGAGKTSLLRILAGETERQPRRLPLRAQRHRRLLRPGARQPARRRIAARQHPRRGAAGRDAHRDAAARPARHVRADRREGRSRTPARCPAARRPSWRWRC